MKKYLSTHIETSATGDGLDIELVIDGVTVGRITMRDEEIYHYPITEVTGKGGRTLLYEVKVHDPRTCENSVPCLDCENIK